MKWLIENWNSIGKNQDGAWFSIALGPRPGKVDPVWRNFKPLPNVRRFRLNSSTWDDLLLKFGIFKNFDPSAEVIAYRNKRFNRYVEHQLLRLQKIEVEADYWRLVRFLLKKSSCFRVMALHHVFPQWYKKWPMFAVVNLLRRVDMIANDPHREMMDVSRVYVEKASGKWRPVGVPSPAWRIYLHQVGQFMSYRWNERLNPNQYGFRPGRSTFDAWKKILKDVVNAGNIYEYDLKGFFDSVRIPFVMKILEMTHGVPKEMTDEINAINRAYVKLPRETKVDETLQRDKEKMWKADRHHMAGRTGMGFFPGMAFLGMTHTGYASTGERSFPQGSPTSPILSILALEQSLFKLWRQVVQYADDGLWYGDESFKVWLNRFLGVMQTGEMPKDAEPHEVAELEFQRYLLKEAGISFAWEKSGLIKEDGKWKKKLKFLGYLYDGETGTLSSQTRSGKSLVYDKEKMLEAMMKRDTKWKGVDNSSGSETPNSFYYFVRSKYIGFVQSRLFDGSWNQENKVWGEMTLKYINDSIIDKIIGEGAKNVSNFNASSLAIRVMLGIRKKVALASLKSSRMFKTSMAQALGGADSSVDLSDEERPKSSYTPNKKVSPSQKISWADFRNRSKWLKSYYATPLEFTVFVEERIAVNKQKATMREGWKTYTDSESRVYYWHRYVHFKSGQVERAWLRRDFLLALALGEHLVLAGRLLVEEYKLQANSGICR